MMRYEFESLAGYEVSADTYSKVIEPMYMAVDLPKEDFVKLIDKKAVALPTKAQMVHKMRELARYIREWKSVMSVYDQIDELERIAGEFAKRFYGVDSKRDVGGYVFFRTVFISGYTYPQQLVVRSGERDFVFTLI